jgi:hypothetical protein
MATMLLLWLLHSLPSPPCSGSVAADSSDVDSCCGCARLLPRSLMVGGRVLTGEGRMPAAAPLLL